MKKFILLMSIAFIAMSLSAVTWQIALLDAYGDGWNGGLVTVYVNGTAVLTDLTIADGTGPEYYDFTVADQDEVTTSYTAGSWSSENYYAILDQTSAIVAESGGTWDSPGTSTPVSITEAIIVNAPEGAPGIATNPNPANGAYDVPLDGNLTWTFGENTETYELWFGEAGNMTMVASGAAETGIYAYSNLTLGETYTWQVISQNSTRLTTTGPVWSFIAGEAILMQDGSTTLAVDESFLFFDDGGPSANYANDLDLTYSFLPPDGYRLTIEFLDFYTEAGYDYLEVYNGPDTTSPLLTTLEGGTLPAPFASTASSGALTFRFFSDVSVTFLGWEAIVSSEIIPTIPIFTYNPDTFNYILNVADSPSEWSEVNIANTGGGVMEIFATDITLTGPNAADFELQLTNFTPSAQIGMYEDEFFQVRFAPQSAGTKTAAINIAYGGDNYVVDLQGLAYDGDNLFEDFEADQFPPPGWSQTLAGWQRSHISTTNEQLIINGDASAFVGQYDGDPEEMLITPMVTLDGSMNVLYFKTKGMNNGLGYGESTMRVMYQPEGTRIWTQIGDDIEYLVNTTREFMIDISSLPHGIYRFGFATTTNFVLEGYSSYVALDDIIGPDRYYTPEPPGVATLVTPDDGLLVDPLYDLVFDWLAPSTGGPLDGYRLILGNNPNVFSDLSAQIITIPAPTSTYTIASGTLDWDTTYYWAVKPYSDAYGSLPNSSHTIYSFTTMAEELVAENVILNGELSGADAVALSWLKSYNDGNGQWIHWDGDHASAIGTAGVADFSVATKFTTTDLSSMVGETLTAMSFFPNVDDAFADYTVRVWAGTDGDLIPTHLIYEAPIELPIAGQWNEAPLPNIPITGTEALYIGYHVVTTTGHPAGCDAGPVVTNGNLVQWGGVWQTLVDLGATLTYNWNIRAFVTDTAPARTTALTRRPVPVVERQQLSKRPNLSLDPATANNLPDRLFSGYNVYRNGDLITAEPIAVNSYLDEALPLGANYQYQVEAIYASQTVLSNTVDMYVEAPDPLTLPFTEDWTSGSYDTNYWATGSTNWTMNSSLGNPAPSASFSWTPQVTDYSMPLTSYEFDATGISNVALKFDLMLDNYSTAAENVMSWEVWDGTTWNTLGSYSSLNDDLAWTSYSVDISDYASNRLFKIRFVASGEDSYEINYWYLDNITLEEPSPVDMAATAIAGPALQFIGETVHYDITVFNNGFMAQDQYTVKLMSVDTREELASLLVVDTLAPGEYATHDLGWNPALAGTYQVYGQVVATGDETPDNDQTDTVVTSIYPANTYTPLVGDPNTNTSSYQVPMNLFYENSVTETIYRAAELQMTSGTINGIIYYNTFVEDIVKPVKVWMQHTTESNLTANWLDASTYTLVFDGVVHFPAGENIVHIPLDTPFEYTGGNLALRVYHVWQDEYWSSSNQFYYTESLEFPNRSRCQAYDGTAPLDPINLLDGSGNPFTGTVSSKIPLTSFLVNPAVPVAALDAPVVAISNVGTDILLEWPAVDGAYAYRVYASDDPQTWPEDPLAIVHTNMYQTAAADKGFFSVVAVSTYRNQNLGLVLNPANRPGALVPPQMENPDVKK